MMHSIITCDDGVLIAVVAKICLFYFCTENHSTEALVSMLSIHFLKIFSHLLQSLLSPNGLMLQ